MEEVFKNEGGVDVGFGQCDEIHVEVPRVEEGAIFDTFYWRLGTGLLCSDYLYLRGDIIVNTKNVEISLKNTILHNILMLT